MCPTAWALLFVLPVPSARWPKSGVTGNICGDWENVREITVNSSAPALVYEEGNLIQRCIRDIYSKDFEEVVVWSRWHKLARSI